MKNSISICLLYFLLIFYTSPLTTLLAQSEMAYEHASRKEGEGAYVKGITPDRVRSLLAGLFALISLVIGWRAGRRGSSGQTWKRLAVLSGILAILLSLTHLFNTTGGFGTGGGKAGAIAALTLGAAGVILSGIALRAKN